MKLNMFFAYFVFAFTMYAQNLTPFNGAYGGGSYATGGSSGNVYHVSNLNDSGDGSLRWALQQARPATIVFDVSGTIDLVNWLTIKGQDLTIAGQTAPLGGITITSQNNSRFNFDDCNNMIIRYLRIRMNDSNTVAMDVYGNTGVASNLMFDHISISYGGLQAMVIRGNESRNVTFQKGLIAESKTGTLFGDSQQWKYSYNNSFLNTLFYNVSHRLPNSGSGGRVDHINNVIQNWRFRMSFVNGNIKLNQINNYYAGGARTSLISGTQRQINQVKTGVNPDSNYPEDEPFSYDYEIYSAGNIIDKGLFTNANADNSVLWAEFDSGTSTNLAPQRIFVNTMHELIGEAVPILTANEAYDNAVNNPDFGCNKSLNNDGSFLSNSDSNDSEYLEVVSRGEGSFEPYSTFNDSSLNSWFSEQRYINFVSSISSTPTNTRPSNYYVTNPHIPEVWFQANVPTGEDHNYIMPDGRTALENFLNMVDVPQQTTQPLPTIPLINGKGGTKKQNRQLLILSTNTSAF